MKAPKYARSGAGPVSRTERLCSPISGPLIRSFAASLVAACLFVQADVAKAADVYVIDGDTLDIDGERIRLRSEAGPIDAPELRKAKCPLELFRAQAARERLAAIMAPNDFSVDPRGRDRYGRNVAIVYSEAGMSGRSW
jgi:endonuclease YncB( thermonuclease family)